ncbi:MAG TPA: hypothetical protein VKK31_10555 [Thermoanaerobaculia bacterium]|nr:hypothetical protein [Thermoanaerobaculia bacterium]
MALPEDPEHSPSQEEPLWPSEPEGDDDYLILWMLSLTPTQRLEVAQGFVDSVMAIRNGHRV